MGQTLAIIVLLLIAAALLFVLGSFVVKLATALPGLLSTFGSAIGRGDPVALLAAGAIVVCLVVLVVIWRGAAPGGVYRRGHWEHRGEDRVWVPDRDN